MDLIRFSVFFWTHDARFSEQNEAINERRLGPAAATCYAFSSSSDKRPLRMKILSAEREASDSDNHSADNCKESELTDSHEELTRAMANISSWEKTSIENLSNASSSTQSPQNSKLDDAT
ncbi:hypothetical protein [Alcanivorax sediminis]|uniref:Uncharacterized protein n=1 Tax=Alcanivorax sediminis TaxID=2663008 RepID=A0A6N7LRB5_9GAMM|nr:hypothetical protein [Alcanivorax sediminis]MQX52928.1 hypothetical protein [Alcanivorax sediminis]